MMWLEHASSFPEEQAECVGLLTSEGGGRGNAVDPSRCCVFRIYRQVQGDQECSSAIEREHVGVRRKCLLRLCGRAVMVNGGT